MSTASTWGPLGTWYEGRIGEPQTSDEIQGYWLFVLGVVAGIVGLIVFLVTEGGTTARGVGYAIAGLMPVFVMLGAVIRFPLRSVATWLAGLGALLSIAGVIWFVTVFPSGWSTESGHLGIIAVYTVGIAVIGVAGAFVPLLSDPIREDYERMQAETSAREAAREAAEDEAAEQTARASSLLDELADLQTSKARFELYEDAQEAYRWRLRHRNGNIIADSGEGYSSKQKCQQGLSSVQRNALGAGVLDVEAPGADDEEEPATAIVDTPETADSQATFEVFEDEAGEWRWRLRHDNGNILADSGEGYASRSNLNRAVSRIRDHIAAGTYLEIDPVAYEIFQDHAGEYRWRLIHENGNILADSGEGYSSRSSARRAVERVRDSISGAEVTDT